MLAPWKKSYDKSRQCIKKWRHHFADRGLYSQACGFSSSLVWMWELDHKEGWELKNWWIWTVVLEKTLESPLDSKEIQPVHPKGNQSWIFIGRTDAEAETPVLFLAILIPACASSSPAFLMMYSSYKLNKQGDNMQPWHTPFPIWNQSVVKSFIGT